MRVFSLRQLGLLCLSAFLSWPLLGQSLPDPPPDTTTAAAFHTRTLHYFGKLDPASVRSGFLLDYGLQLGPVAAFQGREADTSAANPLVWRQLYGTLMTAGFSKPARPVSLPHLADLNAYLDKAHQTTAGHPAGASVPLLASYERRREKE